MHLTLNVLRYFINHLIIFLWGDKLDSTFVAHNWFQTEKYYCGLLSAINLITKLGFILTPSWNILPLLTSPSAAYLHQSSGSAMVQIMACRLFGAKPLPEPMLVYCQLDSWEQISVEFKSDFYHFTSRKFIWNCRLPKWQPFCSGGDELTHELLETYGDILSTVVTDAMVLKQQAVSIHRAE